MLLSRKSIIKDTALKATEISRKMDYCFPDYRSELDISYINIFTILYYHELQHKPREPLFEGRDRLILTRGKAVANLVAVLAEVDYFGWNSALQVLSFIKENENPLLTDVPGTHSITSQAGLAVTIANGLALQAKSVRAEFSIYVVLENGNDPAFYETLYSTSCYKLDNVVAILKLPEGIERGPVLHNWFALGWHIEEVDFQDIDTIFGGFSRASRTKEKPTVLIG